MTQLLVTDMGDDLLKARLTNEPCHPRALVTLAEGLALWHGAPLCIAASADGDARDCFERIFYGGGFLPPASPLVTFEVAHRNTHPQRLHGLGDFRPLRHWEQLR
jgi:hypothetical protein